MGTDKCNKKCKTIDNVVSGLGALSQLRDVLGNRQPSSGDVIKIETRRRQFSMLREDLPEGLRTQHTFLKDPFSKLSEDIAELITKNREGTNYDFEYIDQVQLRIVKLSDTLKAAFDAKSMTKQNHDEIIESISLLLEEVYWGDLS